MRRVCARPAPDSDPVRRHGPERGSTGGGGRPRSFPSGPPLRGGPVGWNGRRAEPVDLQLSPSRATATRPAASPAADRSGGSGRGAEPVDL